MSTEIESSGNQSKVTMRENTFDIRSGRNDKMVWEMPERCIFAPFSNAPELFVCSIRYRIFTQKCLGHCYLHFIYIYLLIYYWNRRNFLPISFSLSLFLLLVYRFSVPPFSKFFFLSKSEKKKIVYVIILTVCHSQFHFATFDFALEIHTHSVWVAFFSVVVLAVIVPTFAINWAIQNTLLHRYAMEFFSTFECNVYVHFSKAEI